MFSNTDKNNCPVFSYRIQQKFGNTQREWGSVRDVVSIDEDGYITIDESRYNGEEITAQIQAWTNYRVPIERQIKITEKIIPKPNCIEQTVEVANNSDYIMNAVPANLTAEEPLDT